MNTETNTRDILIDVEPLPKERQKHLNVEPMDLCDAIASHSIHNVWKCFSKKKNPKYNINDTLEYPAQHLNPLKVALLFEADDAMREMTEKHRKILTIIEWLVKHGATSNVHCKKINKNLFEAIENFNIEEVDNLIKAGQVRVKATVDISGINFIRYNPDIWESEDNHITPLHYACLLYNQETDYDKKESLNLIIFLLIEAGAYVFREMEPLFTVKEADGSITRWKGKAKTIHEVCKNLAPSFVTKVQETDDNALYNKTGTDD